jgi:hypothetical protein
MPANSGSTVQLQTASIMPLMAATGYVIYFGESAPKYLSTDSFGKREAMAPAKKKAGTRHKSTCRAKYSRRASIPENNNVLNMPFQIILK